MFGRLSEMPFHNACRNVRLRRAQWVGGAVAVAFAIGDPAHCAAVGHRHRHRIAAGRLHLPERGLGSNGVDACQQAVGVSGSVLAQYQRTGA